MSEVKTSRKLLVSEILRGDPCYTYSQRLRERFNVEIDVTVELAESQSDDWDWYWAASRLLTQDGYNKFSKAVNQASQEAERVLRPYRDLARVEREEAGREYDRVLLAELASMSSPWTYHERAYALASKAYAAASEVSEAALAAVRKVTTSRVNKVAAKAFAEIYIGEEGTMDPTGNDRYYDRDDDYSDEYEDDDYDSSEDY